MHDVLRTPSEHRGGSCAFLSSSTSLLNQVVRMGDALAFSTRTIWLCFGHAALLTTERVDSLQPTAAALVYISFLRPHSIRKVKTKLKLFVGF